MNPIRRICRSAALAAGLAVALLTSATLSPAANALIMPPPGGPAGPANTPPRCRPSPPAACRAGRSPSSLSAPRSSPPRWPCSWTVHVSRGGTWPCRANGHPQLIQAARLALNRAA